MLNYLMKNVDWKYFGHIPLISWAVLKKSAISYHQSIIGYRGEWHPSMEIWKPLIVRSDVPEDTLNQVGFKGWMMLQKKCIGLAVLFSSQVVGIVVKR